MGDFLGTLGKLGMRPGAAGLPRRLEQAGRGWGAMDSNRMSGFWSGGSCGCGGVVKFRCYQHASI